MKITQADVENLRILTPAQISAVVVTASDTVKAAIANCVTAYLFGPHAIGSTGGAHVLDAYTYTFYLLGVDVPESE